MSKLICILVSFLIMGSASFAQGPAAKNTVPAAQKSPAVPTAAQAAKTKKDGTPDMRAKVNKKAAKPAGPVKKDGTPDMRYKANKAAKK